METIRLTSAASRGTRVFLYVHHVWLNTAGSQHLFPHAPHQAQPVRRAGSVQISGQGCVLTVISTGGSCSEASSPSSAPAPCHPPLSVPQPCPGPSVAGVALHRCQLHALGRAGPPTPTAHLPLSNICLRTVFFPKTNKTQTTTKIHIICIGSLIKGPGTSNTFCVASIYSRPQIS